MSSVIELESSLDTTIETLLKRIDEVTEVGQRPLDTSAWLSHFAFDAMGALNFSSQFGFLETGTDVNGCAATVGVFIYCKCSSPEYPCLILITDELDGSMIGQIPWVHKFLLGNPLLPKLLPQFEASNSIQNVCFPRFYIQVDFAER